MYLKVYLLLTFAANFVSCNLETSKKTCDTCNCSVPTVIDCSFRNLKRIPRNVNVKTTVLNLSSNHITQINNKVLEQYQNLIVLDLSNNFLMIDGISNFTFHGLSKLKVLNISNNDQLPLTNVTTPLMLFDSLRSLEVLKMYGTTGTSKVTEGYPGTQLGKLKALKELWIDGRENMKFDAEFRNIRTLRTLRLAGDHIEPSWRSKEYCMMNIGRQTLENLVSITHLYIRRCNVEKVDKDAFKGLQNLQYLDLSHNTQLTLEGISDALGSLQNKTNTLVLNDIETVKPNKYTVVFTTGMAQSLSHIPLLELHLDSNRIELIEPEVFETLPKTLQIVSVKQNEFYPGYYVFSIRFLENLTHLDLSYQSFTTEWAVLHQSSEHNFVEAFGFSNEIEEIKSTNDVYTSEINVTESREKFPVDIYSEMNWRSGNYDNKSYEMRRNESDKITKSQNIKTPEEKVNLSEQYIMDFSGLSFTCPQINHKHIPPGTVISYLPPKLEHLDISVSKLATPVFQIVLNKENSLKSLNASQSLLYCWEGPVVGLEKLQVLDLSENNCYNISTNFFGFALNLKELYLQGNILGSVFKHNHASEIMESLKSLEVLNLAYNRIDKIPSDFFLSQRNLVKLLAYGNVIEEFGMNIGHMTKLRELDLSFNYISSLSESKRRELESISSQFEFPTTTKNKLVVNLKNNPIHCYCYNMDFLKWTLKHSDKTGRLVIEISECLFHTNLSKVNIVSSKHFEYMISRLEKDCKSYVGLIIGLLILISLIINIVLGIIVHKHRWQIQYWYYVVLRNYNFRIRLRKRSYEEIVDPYKYDVFVASPFEPATERTGKSFEDEDFVMEKLRPVFKSKRLVSFIQVYHIQGNMNLIRHIGRAIHASRVVLFIFSKDWHNDDSMKIAVHMWQCDVINRKNKHSILGIKLDEMTGADADMIKDLYCHKIMNYQNDSDSLEKDTFWRECTSQIQQILRRSSRIADSQL